MARPIPFNRTGIYGIKSVGTPTLTATELTYHFEEHPFVQSPYNGILIVNLTTDAPTGATGTLPVFFQTGNGAKVAVKKAGGVPLTIADVLSAGYYLLFFDRGTGTLQVFNSVV